jgi:hypothetical protein
MRPLTLEAYKLMYIITGAKKFSYYFSLILNTIMHVIVLKGIIEVTKEIAPTGALSIAFQTNPHRPFIVITAIFLFFINTRVVPVKMLDVVGQVKTKFIMLIIYFLIACILFAYMYADGKFF